MHPLQYLKTKGDLLGQGRIHWPTMQTSVLIYLKKGRKYLHVIFISPANQVWLRGILKSIFLGWCYTIVLFHGYFNYHFWSMIEFFKGDDLNFICYYFVFLWRSIKYDLIASIIL